MKGWRKTLTLVSFLAVVVTAAVTPHTDPSPWVPEADPKSLKALGKLGEELNECGAAVARCIIQDPYVSKDHVHVLELEGGKDVTYYFADKGNKEAYHEEVCGGGKKEGTVTGVVAEKDGKKWITPSKVAYAK